MSFLQSCLTSQRRHRITPQEARRQAERVLDEWREEIDRVAALDGSEQDVALEAGRVVLISVTESEALRSTRYIAYSRQPGNKEVLWNETRDTETCECAPEVSSTTTQATREPKGTRVICDTSLGGLATDHVDAYMDASGHGWYCHDTHIGSQNQTVRQRF